MTERYEYTFASGFSISFAAPLPFALLKIAIDTHGALTKCRKVVVKNED